MRSLSSATWLSYGLLCAIFISVGQCHPAFLAGASGGGGAGKGSDRLAAPTSIKGLLDAEKTFVRHIEATNPGFFKQSALGQNPSFMFLGCSDSRVSEGTIFHTEPGVLFAGRNIGAQYYEDDKSGNAVLTYAVHHLGVPHVIVMGHYGCGGVAAAITSTMKSEKDAKDSIDKWIWPIRELYLTSNRSEIVQFRNKNKSPTTAPPLDNEGYRALVEENVKANVHRILKSAAVSSYHGKKVDVYGWVYDIANGAISDLNVTSSFGK